MLSSFAKKKPDSLKKILQTFYKRQHTKFHSNLSYVNNWPSLQKCFIYDLCYHVSRMWVMILETNFKINNNQLFMLKNYSQQQISEFI